MSMSERGVEYLGGTTKRHLDILGSFAIGLASSPFVAIAATISSLDTHAAPFYRQPRIGLGEEEFTIYKLRTLQKRDVGESKQRYGTYDPRASRWGLLLRRLGIDEVPQLFNVVRGDMSLVGLRPLSPEGMQLAEDAEPKVFADWREAYLATKPGLTGVGQLYQKQFDRCNSEVRTNAMRLDLQYVEQASVLVDMRILRDTPVQLLKF